MNKSDRATEVHHDVETKPFHRLSTITDTGLASDAQTRIWLDQKMRFDSGCPLTAIYNMPFLYRVRTGFTLSIQQLDKALPLIVEKHESLQTSLIFDTEKNRLMQRIMGVPDGSRRPFELVQSIFETDEELSNAMQNEKQNSQLFNVGEGLVFRCHVMRHRESPSEDVLRDKDAIVFNFHHAIFDRFSLDIFISDLHRAYTAGIMAPDKSNCLRYIDYVAMEQAMPMSAANIFWLDTLYQCDLAKSIQLPYDRYRLSTELPTGRATAVHFHFGEELSEAFLSCSSANNITPEQLALACYFVFLFQLTNGENELCIGVNTPNRYKEELTSIIGLFENTIPIRCQLDCEWSLRQLFEHVGQNLTNCLAHSYYPLRRILAQYSGTKTFGFLQTVFKFEVDELENRDEGTTVTNGQLFVPFQTITDEPDETISEFDYSLTIQHYKHTNRFSFTIDASVDLFRKPTVYQMTQQFHSLLQQITDSKVIFDKKPVYEISLTLPDDLILTKSMNNTEVIFPPTDCIHYEIVHQVMKQPQKMAVELDEQGLTYAELVYYSQVVSTYLVKHYDVRAGNIICQCVERSLSMVLGMLAIEMTGAVYCPLSPLDPPQRLRMLVEQTQCRLVLVHSATKNKFDSGNLSACIDELLWDGADKRSVCVDCFYHISPQSTDVAYVIFTSGSTGVPKMVQVQHRSFTGCIQSFTCLDIFNAYDIVIQMARCSFDIHVQESFGTLMVGGSLIMLGERRSLDMNYIMEVFISKGVSYISTVPSVLQSMLSFAMQEDCHSCLRYMRSIDAGGEALSRNQVNILKSEIPSLQYMWNMYGPAETTIASTFYLLAFREDLPNISIGVPLCNYLCSALTVSLQHATGRQSSELCIGGVGVFRGYLRREDLTAKSFLYVNGQVFYRTGDIVRFDQYGLLHYEGRKDNQVKLRGQRIELGEIERCLLKTSISACVVIKWKEDHLLAYVEASDIDIVELRKHCRAHLPQHMIPALFVVLEKLPLNANGKIDRKRLLTSEFLTQASSTRVGEYKAPTTELEIRIHSVWCNILQQTQISIDDDFFSIGGHSLLFVQLYHNYKNSIIIEQKQISINEFMQYPTIADHARLIQKQLNDQQRSLVHSFFWNSVHDQSSMNYPSSVTNFKGSITFINDPSSRHQPFPVTEIQQAYLIGRQGILDLGKVSCFSYQEYDFPSTFDVDRLEMVWNRLIQRHEALRMTFPSSTEQKIHETVPYYFISVVELDNIFNAEEILAQRRRELSHQLLPADQWPLFDIQITCFHMDSKSYKRLHMGFDLLILDLWSFNLMLRELSQLYYAPNIHLPTLELSYRDYILTEKQIVKTINYADDKEYWTNRLESFPFGPNLPLKCTPNEIRTQRHCSSHYIIDSTIWKELKQRINSRKVTPASVLATAYALVLGKWSVSKHFTLNLPIFNRVSVHAQVNQIIGDFTTILPVEILYERCKTFSEFLQAIHRQLWADLEHITYNGITFIHDLMQKHNTREIVFPVVFTCGIDVATSSPDSNSIESLFDQLPAYMTSETPQTYIDHVLTEKKGHLITDWIYVEGLIDHQVIQDMHEEFMRLVTNLAIKDEVWDTTFLSDLPPRQERGRKQYNQTQWNPSHNSLFLHTNVTERAATLPKAKAVVSSHFTLTYADLLNRAYAIAHHLEEYKVQCNQLIGILMRNGWEQVVACLAILMSGAAYLPLDVDSPHDRIADLLQETNVNIILTQSSCRDHFENVTMIAVDTFPTGDYQTSYPLGQQSPTDLAYVIFTSGSTGKPKGVMISHQAALNTILDINSRLKMSPEDRTFALSHLNFDLSVYDIFGTLISGGTIVIPDHDQYKNPQHWYDMITQHRVTIWNSVPMLMQMLVEHLGRAHHENQLRHILLSGDWIPLSLPESIHRTFGNDLTITSLGGATEASIWSIAFTIPEELSPDWKSIPYGTPLRNQKYYVYDEYLDDCPEWVSGELYIGGVGLADGYWNDVKKTNSSFITHPRTGERLYRTGDYGRFLPSGYIEFLGRKDFQVKVHGHRIELGEIEYHLQQCPEIDQAVVEVDKRTQQLIAFIKPKQHQVYKDEFDESEIEITDSHERAKFKLARYGIEHKYESENNIHLTRPPMTKALMNEYYRRKTYRQFADERMQEAEIQHMFEEVYKNATNILTSSRSVDFDSVSELLSVITPIDVPGNTLPKYRYPSAGSLYPVQVYVDINENFGSLPSGLYYHNPDRHTLEYVTTCSQFDLEDVILHFVGRSHAIAPLYGKLVGSNFCSIETGYIVGLLQTTASAMGWKLVKIEQRNELEKKLEINTHDTLYSFKISDVQDVLDEKKDCTDIQCVFHLKSTDPSNSNWFLHADNNIKTMNYNKEEGSAGKLALFFPGDDDTRRIFDDCQCAIFFIGTQEGRVDAGVISQMLIGICSTINIGVCPIGARVGLPEPINHFIDDVLNDINANRKKMVLHTLLLGKVTEAQKSEQANSSAKAAEDWTDVLKKMLKRRLPNYMLPTHFIILQDFPLSANGKIDRKVLMDICSLKTQQDYFMAPRSKLEKVISLIWHATLFQDESAQSMLSSVAGEIDVADSLGRNAHFTAFEECLVSKSEERVENSERKISVTTSFLELGGNSLVLIRLYQQYQSLFGFEDAPLSIRRLFESDTIAEHAMLLEGILTKTTQRYLWQTLHITRAPASFAQERILLDEKLRFSGSVAVYNEVAAFQLLSGSVSKSQLAKTVRLILNHHKALRTSLTFDQEDGILRQRITNSQQTFMIIDEMTFENDAQLKKIIYQRIVDPLLFDLANGHVLSVEIIRNINSSNSNRDNDVVETSDVLVVYGHHAAMDRLSFFIFIDELRQAYDSNRVFSEQENAFEYIDYSTYERLIDMDTSKDFWQLHLKGFNMNNRLMLPTYRQRSSTNQRSVISSVVKISLDEDIARNFIKYASIHGLTLFQLGLAVYYAFLFRLTHGQNDLCVTCVNANRYRSELQNIIGMFVATLPYRLEVDSHCLFAELASGVREQCLSILQNAHYPLQHILAHHHTNQSKATFLETAFDFVVISSDRSDFSLGSATVAELPVEQFVEAAKFDFALTFIHNPNVNDGQLSYFLRCSQDLFDEETVKNMAKRFEYALFQLFHSNSDTSSLNEEYAPLTSLSITLPSEIEEIKHVRFDRLSKLFDEGPASDAQARIWLDEKMRFDPDYPSTAIHNMPFLYRLHTGCILSVQQFQKALRLVVEKHESLRTALIFDTEKNRLMQCVVATHNDGIQSFQLAQSVFETDEELYNATYNENQNSQLFNIGEGLVFRCHVTRHRESPSGDVLSDKDVIIFNFHHAIFDRYSIDIFICDLHRAYNTGMMVTDKSNCLRYIDYAAMEQAMPMSAANIFWLDTLYQCDLAKPIQLPYDRYRLSNELPTGRATSVHFDFGEELSKAFLACSSTNKVTPEQLALSCYLLFLFQLTNGEDELCIGMNTANRYKQELTSIIGLFENTIPIRCQLDYEWSLRQLCEYVGQNLTNCLEHSYYPLRRILSQYSEVKKFGFLETLFKFQIDDFDYVEEGSTITNGQLFVPLRTTVDEQDEIISDLDYCLTIQHHKQSNRLSFKLDASLDLFRKTTVYRMAQQFHSLLQQITDFKLISNKKPVYEISLNQPDDLILTKSVNNTEIIFPTIDCIHHEIVRQAMKQPQKMAVELDEQGLTYAELVYYSQFLSVNLLEQYDVHAGDIICQCVERSLSMVVGMLAIQMSGAVYCPLSPLDPPTRLCTLVEQTRCRLVLVHGATKNRFDSGAVFSCIDEMMLQKTASSLLTINGFSRMSPKSTDVAYVIFTSGSTGVPKTVQVLHFNFIGFVRSLTFMNVFNGSDTMIQVASSSFDVHLQEIFGTLFIGASLVILDAKRFTDVGYTIHVLSSKHITCITTVPCYLLALLHFAAENDLVGALKCLRTVDSGGESFCDTPSTQILQYFLGEVLSPAVMNLLKYKLPWVTTMCNSYGPAEATIDSILHFISFDENFSSTPIGAPLCNYLCHALKMSQHRAHPRQTSELCLGGIGVFPGYLYRDDLTAKSLFYLNNQVFYRTGDIVRFDQHGFLHYEGRKDHQIKLHGQRIELGEIERCLLQTSISACVVIKWGEDHIAAYVEGTHINMEQLREHCQSHLPQYMVPSFFVVLEKLPFNANGKIDRKQLPVPQTEAFTSPPLPDTEIAEIDSNHRNIQVRVHGLWCEILGVSRIHTETSFFAIGGHSLLLIQLHQLYQKVFHLQTSALSVTALMSHPTILRHSQIIRNSMDSRSCCTDVWTTLHLLHGPASHAQQRIYLDERIRFSSDTNNNIYGIPLVYRMGTTDNYVSISRLRKALETVIRRHAILRTTLTTDTNGNIIQICPIINQKEGTGSVYGFSVVHLLTAAESDVAKIIEDIIQRRNAFDLESGRVIEFFILRISPPNQASASDDTEFLTTNDLVLFNIHHSAFDGVSTSIFLNEFTNAYVSNQELYPSDHTLQYIDYSVYEHQMDMQDSRAFWKSQLFGYNLDSALSLSRDRERSSTTPRLGNSSSAQINFDNEIRTAFLNYAALHEVTPFQLGLAAFYSFLYKLAHRPKDICVACVNANRYRNETQDLIGMFVATLPYRIELDADWTFDELVKYVRDKCVSIVEHTHYPLQHILADHNADQSKAGFLQTVFDCILQSSDSKEFNLDNATFQEMSMDDAIGAAKFDFSLTIVYDATRNDGDFSCYVTCSADVFEQRTVDDLAQRFENVMLQLFASSSTTSQLDLKSRPLTSLNIVLPKEAMELNGKVFHRCCNIVDEAPASDAQARIWLDEKMRFDPDYPSTAIHNMPFLYRLHTGCILSVQQFQKALRLVVEKHESLRTALIFDTEKNRLMQCVVATHNDGIQSFQLDQSVYETDEELYNATYNENQNSQLFNIGEGLVFRCHVIRHRESPSEDVLSDKDAIIFNFHHAVFDFPSMDIFLNDLKIAYTTNELTMNNELCLRYLDFAVIEQQLPMTAASIFWLDALHGFKIDRVIQLPFDRHRRSDEHRSGRGLSASVDFGEELSFNFITIASSINASYEQLALFSVYAFLFKLTTLETDLCVGINVNGRYKEELRSVIGMFVNAIPLRCQLDPHSSFLQCIQKVKTLVTNSLAYSYFPLQRILAQHPYARNPAFLDTSFQFLCNENNYSKTDTIIGDARLFSTPVSIAITEDEIMSKFDFMLSIEYDADKNGFSCTIDTSLDLFNKRTVDEMVHKYHCMLKQIFTGDISYDETPIYALSLLLPDETIIIKSMNNTETSLPPAGCIHHEFARQVMKQPQKLAVELDEQSLTYAELLYYAQILSLSLLKEHHINLGEIVTQYVERSLSMVIGIIAIQMVGGVYTPLSPQDPPYRLQTLIKETHSRIVLTHSLTSRNFESDAALVNMDQFLLDIYAGRKLDLIYIDEIPANPKDLAYIVFTSGSTGIPKAVSIRQENFIKNVRSVFTNDASETDTILQLARCSFDVHIQEILSTLLIGASIIMLHSNASMDFEYLRSVIQTKQATCMFGVPSLFQELFSYIQRLGKTDSLQTLRSLGIGGESFPSSLAMLITELKTLSCNVSNIYGPAETTLGSIIYPMDISKSKTIVPVGGPFRNYYALTFDGFLQSNGIQQISDLFIGGVGVFAGYFHRSYLTAKSMIFVNGCAYYNTGDLIRLQRNNTLHYEGRKDHQVKLHGQRIELGEIEQCLLKASVSACVVIKWKEDHLVAHVVGTHIDTEELRKHCQAHLPQHMVPSLFVVLEKLPLNANGKIDRKMLPEPTFVHEKNGENRTKPLNDLEKRVKRVFEKAFRNESPNIDASFGELGGTSLDALRAVVLIREEIYSEFNAALLFAKPSVRQLAQALSPLLSGSNKFSGVASAEFAKFDDEYPMRSVCMESLGIVLLICHWVFPLYLTYRFNSLILCTMVPTFHGFSYLFYRWLISCLWKFSSGNDSLYSWQYYRWWFLNNLWSINLSYWLKHFSGTIFYNCYLRLCGAEIGRNSHIYTTLIDTPWLIKVGESSFVGDDVIFSNISYQEKTYKLREIHVGSNCSISTRCVLDGDTVLLDYSYVEPMSAVTGIVNRSQGVQSVEGRLISSKQVLFQFISLLSLLMIHLLTFSMAKCVFSFSSILLLPIPFNLALSVLTWMLTSLCILLVILKFVIRPIKPGSYPLNSFYYLKKLWLRQLVITSFQYVFDFLPSRSVYALFILRWLGANVQEDIQLAEFHKMLHFPSNLLIMERGLTTFAFVKLSPFIMTKNGLCCVDEIHLGPYVNLGNWCTIMPGAKVAPGTIVGSYTLVTQDTVSSQSECVLLGIPAREVFFSTHESMPYVDDTSYSVYTCIPDFLKASIMYFVVKYLLFTLYMLVPLTNALIVHGTLFCLSKRYSERQETKQSRSRFTEVVSYQMEFLSQLQTDFFTFIAPYLSGTQLLVNLYRILGATIGNDVILPDLLCITDPSLVYIGDHIRLNSSAYIVAHSFERRVWKVAPICIGNSCILKSYTLVQSGTKLLGQNRLLPWTLVMKDDQLPRQTNWTGVPAQQIN